MATLPADLNTLTVNQLKEHLSSRGIEVKGKKADYVKALQEALEKEKSTAPKSTPPTTAPVTKETKKDNVPESDDVDVTSENEATNASEKAKNAPQNGASTSDSAPTTEPASGENTVSSLTAEDKKRKRAERFGIPVKEMSDESKKEQRGQRFGMKTDAMPKPPVNLDKAKRLGLPVRGGGQHFAPLHEGNKPLGLDKSLNKTWSKEEDDKKKARAERFGLKQPSSLPQAKKAKIEQPPSTNGAATEATNGADQKTQ